MLAADKTLLQSTIRQSATSLKEKEFLLHHDNLTTVGTQAAVMAGFTVTALIEFGPPARASRILKFLYYNLVILSLTANILCITKTTCLSVMGTSLAMRGPDGSVTRAVNGMYELRAQVFALFGVGMMSLLFMAILGSWLLLESFHAAVATLVLGSAIGYTYKSYLLISNMFFFREEEAVSFDDILAKFRNSPVAAAAAATRSLSAARLAPRDDERRRVSHQEDEPPRLGARSAST